jgi:adenosylcobinamide-GDP ribazoletransferase
MKRFLIALQFLTILPVQIKSRLSPWEIGHSLVYFPIVGALIGCILALSLFILQSWPPLITSALLLIILIVITGAVHLEGFADTCDGFYAGGSKEKILEIMRDSHIGAIGAIGLICLMLLKFTLFVHIVQEGRWQWLIMMAAFARWAQGLACFVSDYARREGKAKYFIKYARGEGLFIAGLFTLFIFLLLVGLKAVAIFGLALLAVFLFINYVKRKIGGMSGDTIGAASELAEIGVLFFALIT